MRLSAAGLAGSAAHTVSLVPENNAGAPAPSISIARNRDYSIREAAQKRRHPCTARRRAVVCARKVRQRPSRKERGKSACGSEQKGRTLKERSGKECVLKKSRSLSGALRGVPAEGVAGDSVAAPAQGKAFPKTKVQTIFLEPSTSVREQATRLCMIQKLTVQTPRLAVSYQGTLIIKYLYVFIYHNI